MPKKAKEGGPFGIFQPHSVGKYQKIEGGPFGDFFFKKQNLTEPKVL